MRAIALFSVFGLLFFAYRCASGSSTPSAPAVANAAALPAAAIPQGPAPALAAADLLAAYQANEVKADMKYKGKRFHISGAVAGVSSGLGDEPHVHLLRELMGVDVSGLTKDRAASLNKGDAFEADCTVSGEVIGSPQVDCS